MTQVKLQEVEIKAFKNIVDRPTDYFNGDAEIVGRNHIGKSNYLNAIYWCLTGKMLEKTQATGNALIPDAIWNNIGLAENNPVVVFVRVKINDTNIARYLTYETTGLLSQHISVNGVEYPIKKAESFIDKALGILELSLLNTKEVNLKEILLNPLSFFEIAESKMREWLFKTFGVNKLCSELYAKLGNAEKEFISQYVSTLNSYDPTILSNEIKKSKKRNEEQYNWWKVVCEYLAKYHALNKPDMDNAMREREQAQLKTNEDEQRLLVCEYLTQQLARECAEKFNFLNLNADVKVNFIEKNLTNDNYTLGCKFLIHNETNYWKLSHSQKVYYGVKIINALVKELNLPLLPILIDDAECFDEKHLNQLANDSENQKLFAIVRNTSDATFTINEK